MCGRVCVCLCVGFVMCGCFVICMLYSDWGCSYLTEVFPCFFLSCKANARVKLAKTGHGPHSSILVVICVVLLLFVLFYVLFVCKCVLYYCHRVSTHLQLTNISYHMFTARIFSETDHVIILFHAVGPEESTQEHSRIVCRVEDTGVLCERLCSVTSRSLVLHSADCEFQGKCSDNIEHAGGDEARFSPVIPYHPWRNWTSNYFCVFVFFASSLFDLTSLIIVIVVESTIL